MGKTSARYAPEVRERAVRMVSDHSEAHGSPWAAIVSIAPKIGCTAETLRRWVREVERAAGPGADAQADAAARVKALERENRELRQANEILRKASAAIPSQSCLPEARRRISLTRRTSMQPVISDAVVIGVDTHKDVHVAVALNGLGSRLGEISAPATAAGFYQLADWARGHGVVHAFGVEGTGCYGAGLSRALAAQGFRIIEVNRPNRQLRRQRGKSDAVDAEGRRPRRAGRSSRRTAEIRGWRGRDDPPSQDRPRHRAEIADAGDGRAEDPARDRSPAAARAVHRRHWPQTLVRGLAALRPGSMTSTTASAKTALRALARRWLALDVEIREHDAALEELVRKRAPALMAAPGISTGTIAEMLVVLGDNPERIRSEAAFAKLCGVCPIPASSGKTTRHRLNRGGNRRANAALYRVAVARMRSHLPTIAYVRRRTAEGKSPREIRRCLKRYIAREIFRHLCAEPPMSVPASMASCRT